MIYAYSGGVVRTFSLRARARGRRQFRASADGRGSIQQARASCVTHSCIYVLFILVAVRVARLLIARCV